MKNFKKFKFNPKKDYLSAEKTPLYNWNTLEQNKYCLAKQFWSVDRLWSPYILVYFLKFILKIAKAKFLMQLYFKNHWKWSIYLTQLLCFLMQETGYKIMRVSHNFCNDQSCLRCGMQETYPTNTWKSRIIWVIIGHDYKSTMEIQSPD